MSARALILVAVFAFAVDAFAACTDNTPTCVPDTVVNDCICNKGDRGHRVCDSDGLHFGQCLCGTAGTGGGSGAAGAQNTGGASEEGGAAGDLSGTAGDLAANGP